MISGTDPNLLGTSGLTGPAGANFMGAGSLSQPTPGTSFSDVLKSNLEEVVKLQQDAGAAVQALATGQTEDVTGVMTAMEKSDVAFKTLLAIRTKLMDAYDEVRNLQI
jgi:flagellar hook-basal body complex protein FliE